ncbi:helix-turn-helix domain-containing protein [Chitinophaga sp.]|uniref:winged helix-turn-helix transcriptional regulator n=1 Tax=Chitinophaga sp. TaxID=1869181 RepID=UPI002606CD0A|nr:helix-turn-helix domain-containing protein [uncultured Chitinophaga sp.]
MMKEFLHDNRIFYNPIEFAMAHIGGTWKIPIILCLRNGPVRYGDLKKSIPHISDKMLFTQLRELEEKQMVVKHTFSEKPPRVEYELTPKAIKALPLIDQFTAYGISLMSDAGII